MEKSCYFDSYEALYECSCGYYLCAKHYFIHKKEFSNHNIKNIKISINSDSKDILVNFIITIKKKLTSYVNQLLLMPNLQQINSNNLEKLNTLNFIFQILSRIYIYLNKTKYVSKRLLYHPIAYFLIQPPNKAEIYIKNTEFPPEDNFNLEWKFFDLLLDFNYFKFEDKNCINGWNYISGFSELNLTNAYQYMLLNFIKSLEYEMAYELIQNIIKSLFLEVFQMKHKVLIFLNKVGFIIYKLIENKNYSELEQEWIELKNELGNVGWNPVLFYQIFSYIFRNLGNNKLACGCLRCAEMISWKNDWKLQGTKIKLELGILLYSNGEYEKSIICLKKVIEFSKKYTKDDINLITSCYSVLAENYSKAGKKQKLKILIENFKKMKSLFDNESNFYYLMGWLFLKSDNFDKSLQYLWRSLKASKERLNLPFLCLALSQVYIKKNEMNKVNEMIYNSQYCLDILPSGDPYYIPIYICLIYFYINSARYQEALECYKVIKKYCFSIELQDVKLSIGSIYDNTLNCDEALKIYIEIKDFISNLPEANKSYLFCLDSFIGEIQNHKKNDENAQNYFMSAFKLIDDYNYCEPDIVLNSFALAFEYFYEKSDYKKCEIILSKAIKLSENNLYDKSVMAFFLALKAKLYNALHDLLEADSCFNKAESIMNIEEMLLYPRRNIKFCSVKDIRFYRKIADAYIESYDDEKNFRAEKILNHVEEIYKVRFYSDWPGRWNMYELLGKVYWNRHCWNESKPYYEKALDLIMKNSCDADAIHSVRSYIDSIDYMNTARQYAC